MQEATQKSLRRRIVEELEQILENQEHRKKRGLETTALREVKGREHYLLSVEILMFEETLKKLDSLMENIQISTARSIRENKEDIAKIRTEIGEIDGRVSHMMAKMSSEIPNIIKDGTSNLAKTISEIPSNIKENSSLIMKSSSDIMTNLRDTNSLIARMQDRIDSISKETISKTDILRQDIQQNGKLFVGMLKENITSLQNTIGNEIKNNHTITLNEIKNIHTTVSNELKANMEIMNRNLVEREQTTFAKLNEITKGMENLIKNTEDRFDKMSREMARKLEEFENDWKKYLESEVKSLRDVIGAIRADVEMQKHLIMGMKGKK